MTRVAVYCGASPGVSPRFAEATRELGAALARAGITVIYGGASRGLMGALADSALGAGGSVVGVLPRSLHHREIAHRGITELHVVETMHERKALISELADAFVVLPGGIGTLDEFFEAWTWAQIGIHSKPIALLDVEGFHQPLLRFLREVVAAGFLSRERLDSLIVAPDVESLLTSLNKSRHAESPVARYAALNAEP